MSDNRGRVPSRPGRLVRPLIAVAALVAALIGPPLAANAAPPVKPPVPTSVTVEAMTDPAVAAQLAGVPPQALPQVLAAIGTPFQLRLSLWNGSAPASFTTSTPVTLAATGGTGALGTTTATIPAGATTITIPGETYSAATAALSITATVGAKKAALTATAPPFPVELKLSVLAGSSLKNGPVGADGAACTTVDAAHPMCGILSLPNGAAGNVAVSLGLCPTGQPCAKGGLVTQFIADMGGLYTRSAPAQMTIVCDKTLCGKGGVNKFTAVWSQTAAGALTTVPACPSKGTIGAAQSFCADYVSSTRDNAGDLLLVVLFLDDVRGSIGG